MVIVVDSQIAGISGDMLLSCLVDLGANKKKIIDGLLQINKILDDTKITKIEFKKITKHGIEATELILNFDEKIRERKGIEIQECIKKLVERIGLSENAKNFSNASIKTLIAAESKIHGIPEDSVHFHEAASIDTVVDIVGTAIALDDLNFFDEEIISTSVAVGGGTLSFSHGTTSNPASAILEIFKNSEIVIFGGQAKEELTTPTGATMLVNLVTTYSEFYPPLIVKSVGYGAGKKEFENFSNVLKIVQGKKNDTYYRDNVKILDTNVDDVSGEVIGNLIEKIIGQGAKDITVTSGLTKKGRPTHLVSIICDSSKMNLIMDLLIKETGTLGVRVRTSERFIVPRFSKKYDITLENQHFSIRLKSTKQDMQDFKIESDDIKLVSNSLKKSFRESEELIRNELKKREV